MGSITVLGQLLRCAPLAAYQDPKTWFSERDTIKGILAGHLKNQPTSYWLDILQPVDYWCSDVLSWPDLLGSEAFQVLDMIQDVVCSSGAVLRTTRCPIRIDGQIYKSEKPAPRVGQHTAEIAALCETEA